MRESDAHLERGRDALQAGRLSLDAGLHLDAISRAYYAVYHAAHALLASRGESARSHKGLVMKTRELFATELGPEPVQALARLQTLREQSDYDVGIQFTKDEAADACDQAERFLQATKDILNTVT